MSIAAQVSSHMVWGNGVYAHTVYRVDVNMAGETWSVYRRYSAFDALHQQLKLIDPQILALDENFPPKIYVGSAIATIGLVVKERFDELKSYLSTVLAIPGISQQQCVHHFVDVEFRGMSGFRKSVESSQIIKEMYVKVSHGTVDFMFMHYWKDYYAGLTKRGRLYLFATMYDLVNERLYEVDLRAPETRVTADLPTRSIKIIYGDERKIFIKLATPEDFSTWLRALSDFGTMAGRPKSKKQDTGAEQRSGGETSKPQLKDEAADDDLSAMYGM